MALINSFFSASPQPALIRDGAPTRTSWVARAVGFPSILFGIALLSGCAGAAQYPPPCNNVLTCKSASVKPVCAATLGCTCTGGFCHYLKDSSPACVCIAGETQPCDGGTTKTCVATSPTSTTWGACQ